MVSPFAKISQPIQDDHTLYGADVTNLATLQKHFDPRVTQYCHTLRSHKRECPICTWPRLYPCIRKFVRSFRTIFNRKIL